MLWHKTIGAGGVGGGSAASISLANLDSWNGDRSSYTFTDVTGLDPSASAWVVGVGSSGSNNTYVSSATIDGQTLTEVVSSPGYNDDRLSWIGISAPTASTSGDVFIQLSRTLKRMGIVVWNVYDLVSLTANDTAIDVGSSPSVSIDVPAGGVCVAVSTANAAATWTGLTNSDSAAFEIYFEVAWDDFASSQTGLTVSHNNTWSGVRLSVASFR